jgi:hypothetical protein
MLMAVFSALVLTSQAFAGTTTFNCVTVKGLENGKVRTISFTLNGTTGKNILIMGRSGRQFKIRPFSNALRALNTYDNGGVYTADDQRIQIGADEIGMYNTQLVLWRATKLKTGYVSTSGESNVKLYSPITCEVITL